MSAPGSEYPSSARPPHRELPSKGTNPLRRTSDRIESWFFRFLMLVLALGLPVASLRAGLTTYESLMRTVQAQSAERHEVTARLTSDAEGAGKGAGGAMQSAQVRWTDRDGRERTGTAPVKPGATKGATARIWVDRQGTITDPPMSASNATATGWMVGGMTSIAVVGGVLAARAGMRQALDRRRYAQWGAEWDLVEPRWSERFRR
ncbi:MULTISPECIES: Rv1733c family protein [unclassified Streptomyces]|uniref:Rv1733c family protein n=1 Tax=unclassified Streptomyces TaxID=2593676 RepID=UPI002E115C34|nr:hypothetical protein OG324_04670 [Streptomyces sp. NBC_01236]